jgi:methyltransferase (TIGR00027 family)
VKEGQASSTAKLIAAAQVLAWRERRLHHLVDLEAAELSERLLYAARGDWLAVAARSWFGRWMLFGFERAMMHGLIWHWLTRKREIEKLVVQALAEGYSQFLVIGAGLDTLPLRLARSNARTTIVCVDHPATQKIVRIAVPEIEREGRVKLVPVNLARQELNAELAGVLEDQPTVVLAEGLLMYLVPQRVQGLFAEIKALPVPRLRLIATAMDTPEGEPISFRPRSPRVERWLAKKSEPMQSSIPAGREAEVLAAEGLRHVRTILAREFRGDRPGLDGENILIAEAP